MKKDNASINISPKYYLIFALAFIVSNASQAKSKGTSYVDDSKPFIAIQDVNRQAEAWAMCAATYDLTAELFAKDRPARAQQFSELANGAELAVAMSIVNDGIVKDISPDKFDALWEAAKISHTELPKTRRTMLLAELESSSENSKIGTSIFLSNLSATLEVCVKNLEAQQMYIDTWRELSKSGLLKLPEE